MAFKKTINSLKDETQADKILKRLVGEINSTWQNRDRIKPQSAARSLPKICHS